MFKVNVRAALAKENGRMVVVLTEKIVLKAWRKCIPSSSPLVPKVEPFRWAIERIMEEDTSNVTLGDAMQEVEA